MDPHTGAYSLADIKAKKAIPPSSAGVYLFRDQLEQILYVGKANNLRVRINSYLQSEATIRLWIGVMLEAAKRVETIIVDSELEALLLEQTLIKKHRPKFNTLLVDDKSFPYIKLVKDGQYPRLQITRKLDDSKASYFGPYLSGYDAGLTLALIRKVYGIHQSHKPIQGNWPRPCLNCQLENGQCPFSGEARKDRYDAALARAVEFLRGKRKSTLVDLKHKMKEASDSQSYELAKYLRDYLRAASTTTAPQGVISPLGESYIAIGVSSPSELNDTVCVVTVRIERGAFAAQRKHFFHSNGQPLNEVVRTFVVGYLSALERPSRLVLLPIKLEGMSSLGQILCEAWQRRTVVSYPLRGKKRYSVTLANKNAEAALSERPSPSANHIEGLEQLASLICLGSPPTRIEVVDISNLGRSGAVGAVVCMIDGKFRKSEYRRYRIKTVKGQNDFAMIQEVMIRRFHDTSRPTPDLFVVDGGPEQLKAAKRGVEATNSSSGMLISIAKKPDRVYVIGQKTSIATSDYPLALQFLARARDEAHRFAVSYQRHTRRLTDKS